MTARNLLTQLYVSTELGQVVKKLRPESLQDDIKQHVFEELLKKPDEFIIGLHERNELKHYVCRLLFNSANWPTGTFRKQFGNDLLVADFEYVKPIDEISYDDKLTTDNDLHTAFAVSEVYRKSKTSANPKEEKEAIEEILLALSKLYWYKADILKIYAGVKVCVRCGTLNDSEDTACIKCGNVSKEVEPMRTYQKLADKTGIPLTSIFLTVRQARDEIKSALVKQKKKKTMIKFLSERTILQERVNAGVDVHPSQADCITFAELGKALNPKGDFDSWRGCQECVNSIVKFVFDNEAKLIEDEKGKVSVMKTGRVNFPKDDKENK